MNKFLLYCLLFSGVFNSSAVSIPTLKPIVSVGSCETTEKSCFLPRVSSITVTEITSTTVTFKWPAVPGASYYRIKIYDSENNDLARNYIVTAQPGTNVSTASGIVPGVSYNISIGCLCSNGQGSL